MIFGNRFWTRAALFLFVAGASLAARADTAQPVPAPGLLEQIMHNLARVKTADSTFVERKYLSILNAPLEFSGTLSYAAPGHLEKRTLLPKPENMLLDQDTLTIENPAKHQRRTLVLQDYPVIWAFVESIRSTLAGDLQTLRRFYRVTLEGNAAQWRLLLVPTDPQMQGVVSEIHISGGKSRIGGIEIIETNGDRSVMTITGDTP